MYEIKIKESASPLVFALCILLFFIMTIMTISLFFEYRFFKQQAERMLELQKDYQEYLSYLKQSCFFKKLSPEESEGAEEFSDEWTEESSDALLNPVNREVLYLRQAALGFGKAHNLERVVRPLYEGGTWDTNYSSVIRSCLEPKQHGMARSTTTSNKRYKRNSKYLYDFSLEWPINKKQFWISSHFGPRKKRFHYGIDMAALKGTPVYPALEGTVVEVSYTPKGYGKAIVLSHKKCKTRYAHLDEIFVKVGQKVTTTKQIGCVGATGLVRGKHDASHLHFEVIDLFGKRINPLYILR